MSFDGDIAPGKKGCARVSVFTLASSVFPQRSWNMSTNKLQLYNLGLSETHNLLKDLTSFWTFDLQPHPIVWVQTTDNSIGHT